LNSFTASLLLWVVTLAGSFAIIGACAVTAIANQNRITFPQRKRPSW
jgi:hypothetical protein